jgi:DNA-binding NtrC family response regulator
MTKQKSSGESKQELVGESKHIHEVREQIKYAAGENWRVLV